MAQLLRSRAGGGCIVIVMVPPGRRNWRSGHVARHLALDVRLEHCISRGRP